MSSRGRDPAFPLQPINTRRQQGTGRLVMEASSQNLRTKASFTLAGAGPGNLPPSSFQNPPSTIQPSTPRKSSQQQAGYGYSDSGPSTPTSRAQDQPGVPNTSLRPRSPHAPMRFIPCTRYGKDPDAFDYRTDKQWRRWYHDICFEIALDGKEKEHRRKQRLELQKIVCIFLMGLLSGARGAFAFYRRPAPVFLRVRRFAEM
ncbi:hypothetical protein BDZ91DRAFT_766820 [Kalaharituber pfeilii]|nr:hypothetical protein BDZ91DRAFT_766820 [Kalaharituber pfeilii]